MIRILLTLSLASCTTVDLGDPSPAEKSRTAIEADDGDLQVPTPFDAPNRVSRPGSGPGLSAWMRNAGGGMQGAIDRTGRWVAFVSLADLEAPGDGVLDGSEADRVPDGSEATNDFRHQAEGDNSALGTCPPGSRPCWGGEICCPQGHSCGGTADEPECTPPRDAPAPPPTSPPAGGSLRDHFDVYLRDLQTGALQRVTHGIDADTFRRVATDGSSLQPSLDDDAQHVVFSSRATNLTATDVDRNDKSDIYVWTRGTDQLRLVSRGTYDGAPESDGDSLRPQISANGRWIVFESDATNLISDDTNGYRDIFRYDLETNQLSRVTELRQTPNFEGAGDWSLQEADQASFEPVLSADGRCIAFTSLSTNLSFGPRLDAPLWVPTIVVHDREHRTPFRRVMSFSGEPPDGATFTPSIDSGCTRLVYTSRATNLAAPFRTADASDEDRPSGIFLVDLDGNLRNSRRVDVGILNGPFPAPYRAEVLTYPGSGRFGESAGGAISPDGRRVLFHSTAIGVTPLQESYRPLYERGWDLNRASDVFVVTLGENGRPARIVPMSIGPTREAAVINRWVKRRGFCSGHWTPADGWEPFCRPGAEETTQTDLDFIAGSLGRHYNAFYYGNAPSIVGSRQPMSSLGDVIFDSMAADFSRDEHFAPALLTNVQLLQRSPFYWHDRNGVADVYAIRRTSRPHPGFSLLTR